MEKKVYAVYRSTKGCKDLVYVFADRLTAEANAKRWTAEDKGKYSYTVNYRVYEVPFFGAV